MQAAIARHRTELFGRSGWRPLHEGGPPFTLSDYRVFVTACLDRQPGPPDPALETSLASFRRALEGTLASAGSTAIRMGPDAFLSLVAELVSPVRQALAPAYGTPLVRHSVSHRNQWGACRSSMDFPQTPDLNYSRASVYPPANRPPGTGSGGRMARR